MAAILKIDARLEIGFVSPNRQEYVEILFATVAETARGVDATPTNGSALVFEAGLDV